MKQIRLQTEIGKKNPLVITWEKNFINDTSKFISSTRLKSQDLGVIFEDEDGESWKILGMMDGKDLPCEKIATGEIFIWDRWKVSNIVHNEEHVNAKKIIEYIIPEPIKAVRKKKEPVIKEVDSQLNLFTESESDK